MVAWASSTSRPLRLRRRLDVRAEPLEFGERRIWGIKDPVSLRYYQLREEEYRIFQMLDRDVSLEEIRDRFEEEFAPKRLSLHQLQGFLGMLHSEGLLVADASGQDEPLWERHRKRSRQSGLEKFSNPLAIRFRGIDPDRALDWLLPRFRWLFSWWWLAACTVLVVAAMVLLAVNYRTVVARLPDFEAFFGWRNAILLAATIAIAKVLHELGHALTCKRFGGEVHEMGVMLLVFTPCLYVNVSDAWMLPNKWHRIAISAAGMIVEIVLAALCAFLWYFSEPGLLNALCLNVVVVCSVSTVLLNGNPLLRYDGYYVLADWLEVPNLRQQSEAIVKQWLGEFFLGTRLHNERMLPDRRKLLLAAYFVASVVYRFVVVFVILWFCHEVLKPYRLDVLARLLAVVVIGGMLARPLVGSWQFVRDPLRTRQVNFIRFVVRVGFVSLAVALILAIPLPHRVAVPVVLQPDEAQRVYASVAGTLTQAAEVGEVVEAGDVVGILENRELRREVANLRGQVTVQELHLQNLERRQFVDRAVKGELDTARKTLDDLREQLRRREEDISRLTLKAPVAGTVLPPTSRNEPPGPGQLPKWTGTPLDLRNRGCFLETGTVVCRIGDPDRLEAVLIVDQADIEFIRTGQPVRLALDESPGVVLTGIVEEVAAIDLKVAPRELLMHEDLPTKRDEQGQQQLVSTAYQARVAFDPHDRPLLAGATGTAKVEADSLSLGSRLVRFLNRTFRVDF